MLKGESSADSSSLLRQQYVNIGLSAFSENPFFGIGIGSSLVLTSQYTSHTTYLHNNFVELLACGGIVGFVLYYSMFLFLAFMIITKRHYLGKKAALLLTLLLVLLISDFGTVSYYTKETHFYFLIFTICVEKKDEVLYAVKNRLQIA